MLERVRLIFKGDTMLIEFMGALAAFFTGLAILNPLTDTIQAGTDAAGAMGELGWGFFMAGIGLAQFLGIISGRMSLRKAGAALMAFMWGFIIVISGTVVAAAIYSPYVIANMLTIVRLERNATVEE